MTTGQLLFYSGAALLGLTLILLIVFLIKKPKYEPESAAYGAVGPNGTQNFRNGYPTVRRGTHQPSGPVNPAMQIATEPLPDPGQDATEPIQ